MRLNGRDFTVVGIGQAARGLDFGFSDALAYMDYRAFRERVDLGDVVSVIAVATSQPEEVRQRILELGSLAAFTPAQLIQRSEEVNAASLRRLLGVFGLLAMTIGGLFVRIC